MTDDEGTRVAEEVIETQPMPGIRLVTLNRPHRLNAITTDLSEGLHAALDRVAGDDACRVVVLTGAGAGFCSGFDLKAGWDGSGDDSAAERYQGQQRLAELVSRLHQAPVPVVAAVNGPAAGGGLALALGADVRIAATTATFAVANVRVGLSGGEMGLSYLLPRVVGSGRAAEMLYSGRTVTAAEAESWGLVNRLANPGSVVDEAMRFAAQVAANAPFGVRLTKEMLRLGVSAPSLEHTLVLENRTQVLAGYSGDVTEAVQAFRAGRQPRFTGRR